MQPGITLKAKVESVHDGDTATFSVTLKFPVRVIGLDCPELSTRDGSGKESAAYAQHLLKESEEVLLNIPSNNPLSLMDSTTLGRILANVTLKDGRDFKEVMIENGYGNEWKRKS